MVEVDSMTLREMARAAVDTPIDTSELARGVGDILFGVGVGMCLLIVVSCAALWLLGRRQ